MAEAQNIDDIAKTAPQIAGQEKKEEQPRKKSTLESFVNESSKLFGNSVKLGLAGAVPYAFASLLPTFKRDTAILTGAQIASDYTTSYRKGKKYTAGNILESSLLGVAMTPVIEGMFRTVNAIPTNSLSGYIAKGSVWGGIMYPVFVAAYQPIAYFIRNRTFKGMAKYVKENYWTALRDAWTKLLPISLLNIFFAPSWLQIPISAGLSYLFDLFGAPQKGEVPAEQKKDKTPYLAAASSLVGKLAKTIFYGVPQATYSIARGVGEKLYSTATTPAKVPSTAPATAPAR